MQEQAGSLGASFEAPLKEYVRMVRSAKAVMADRSLALGALQQARADVDAKRTKLAKLRGTPGIKVGPPFQSFCVLLSVIVNSTLPATCPTWRSVPEDLVMLPAYAKAGSVHRVDRPFCFSVSRCCACLERKNDSIPLLHAFPAKIGKVRLQTSCMCCMCMLANITD